jgi:predicted RNA methylase
VYERPRFLPQLTPKLLRALWRLRSRVGDLLYERDLDTSEIKIEVEHYHPDRVWYAPSGWSYLRRILSPSDVDSRDVFVDFGSGKGRVLYQAAQYPFGRVVGVEVSSDLNDIAKRNLARLQHQLASKVDIVTCDVLRFPIPDDMTYAYFFNPFAGKTFRSVIENIVSSLERHPRRLHLIYAVPAEETAILATGRFRVKRSKRVLFEQVVHRVTLYESMDARRDARVRHGGAVT